MGSCVASDSQSGLMSSMSHVTTHPSRAAPDPSPSSRPEPTGDASRMAAHTCLDARLQFDFLACVYSIFLEILFQRRLPEHSRCVCTCTCGYTPLWGGGVLITGPHCYHWHCHGSVHPHGVGWGDLGIRGMSIWECASDPQTTWTGG